MAVQLLLLLRLLPWRLIHAGWQKLEAPFLAKYRTRCMDGMLLSLMQGEFAFFPTFCISSVAGVVRNPYHLRYTPAGSSGVGVRAPAAAGAAALIWCPIANAA